ncbi:CobW family GTP-binding protein [Kitasatospora sp. NPDC018058]|uniref:CobW family GTP-binding protein n=1 Tax=Kitasatospora sp. NPDC018058 TaxID=3364025 RepID=UPI0037C183EA
MPDDTRLPVGVVAGLHEAERRQAVLELLSSGGNTVVLHHDLTDAAHGRVRRDILDTAGTRREADVPLTGDCPCCALREDLLPELLRIADAGRYRLAVVELWGGSDPHPAVEVIAEGEVDGRCLSEAVVVAGVVAAVDPLRLVPQLSVPDTLREHAADTCADDTRTRAEALTQQIEYATVHAVPRAGDVAGSSELHAGLAMLRQLHPSARTVALGTGALAPRRWPGSTCRPPGTGSTRRPPCSRTRRTRRASRPWWWERRRPLHPARFHEALDLLVPAAQRSRGRFWLANRPDLLLGWDAAGASLGVEECGPWLAALPDASWELYPPQRRAAAALDWDPVHGDRVQQLCFTAEGLDADGIVELLGSCLLTDEELASGEEGWKHLPDAFDDMLDPVA